MYVMSFHSKVVECARIPWYTWQTWYKWYIMNLVD